MKQYIAYMMVLIAFSLGGCNAIEDRLDLGGQISAQDLDISATAIVVDGKKTNRVVLDNKSPVLSSWDYGVGKSQKKTDTVLLVVTGENQIEFTGRNPNGTEISKTLSVTVEDLYYDVPLEWGYLTGGSEKEWVWDDNRPGVWGNGGYLGDKGPAWWVLPVGELSGQVAGEGEGAKMIFSLSSAKFTKQRSDGSEETGTFSFNMSSKTLAEDGSVWAKGKLTLKGSSVLLGISPNEGNAPVREYDILVLDDQQMILSYPESGAGPWGTAWFWVFRSDD